MCIRIKMNVPTSFLEEPIIKNKENELFDLMNEEIEKRITEIWEFIDMNEEYVRFSDNILLNVKDRIKKRFKEKFWIKVLKDAVQLSFDGKGGFNILANTLQMISEENLRELLMGNTLIEIFVHELKAVPVGSPWDNSRRTNKIYLLNQKYIYNDD